MQSFAASKSWNYSDAMASRQGEVPALESGVPDKPLGGISLPIGILRRAISYDDALDFPSMSPPADMSVNILWDKPVIPQRKFRCMVEEQEVESCMMNSACLNTASTMPLITVTKARASSVIMNSLITNQSQESIQRFEQHAGLTDTSYTPHKGLSAEERRFHRISEAANKLKVRGGDFKEDKQTSAQSTPCVSPTITPSVTPHGSPSQNRRSWFSQSPAAALTDSEFVSTNVSAGMGGNEGGGGIERWNFFGTRPMVQKSSTDPGNLSMQPYQEKQNSSSMEVMKTQVARMVEEPASLKIPKIEIPVLETKKRVPRPHKLKPRDMNVLTPSGF